jgi:hypothetical protein
VGGREWGQRYEVGYDRGMELHAFPSIYIDHSVPHLTSHKETLDLIISCLWNLHSRSRKNIISLDGSRVCKFTKQVREDRLFT